MSNQKNDVLVSTEWAEKNLDDSALQLVEVDVDTSSYEDHHIPGAVGWNWKTQLQDQTQRTIAKKDDFEKLLRESGIENDTDIILYGDNNNWFAAWAYWLLKYYGHEKVYLIDGGKKKWVEEERPLSDEKPEVKSTEYSIDSVNTDLRAFRKDVEEILSQEDDYGLVDVRSPEEFSGEKLAPEGLNETCQRGGHIPGASNIPWSTAVNDDGTFKGTEELKQIYAEKGITSDKDIITYCRIGERSAHSWFVLHELLGISDVRNYDGSWTEWGNLVEAPIETGS